MNHILSEKYEIESKIKENEDLRKLISSKNINPKDIDRIINERILFNGLNLMQISTKDFRKIFENAISIKKNDCLGEKIQKARIDWLQRVFSSPEEKKKKCIHWKNNRLFVSLFKFQQNKN